MQPVGDLVGRFVTIPNIGVAVAISVFLAIVTRALPGIFRRPAVVRAQPFFDGALGIITYAAIPLLSPPGAPVGERLLTGFVIGMLSSKFYKVVSQTVLGKDARISPPKS